VNNRQILELVRAQGYVVVSGVLSADRVTELRDRIIEARAADEARFGRQYLYDIGQEGFIQDPLARDCVFGDLLDDFPLAPVIRHILGPDAALYLYQGVIVPPGGGIGAYPWKWHCDLYHLVDLFQGTGFIPGLNCLIYLDDVGPENGATWLMPGSQGMSEGELPFTDAAFRTALEFQITASAGSALLFNPLLWHCAGANHTQSDRCALKLLSVRGWMLPQLDYARSASQGTLARLSPEGRAFLGSETVVRRSFQDPPPTTSSGSPWAGELESAQ
jgi:ectoine hydroxylase-related dioxygenase (phytanoyl-CoA dioxygenase family)